MPFPSAAEKKRRLSSASIILMQRIAKLQSAGISLIRRSELEEESDSRK